MPLAIRASLLFVCLLLLLGSTLQAQYELQRPVAGATPAWSSLMFNVEAAADDLRITSIDTYFNVGTWDVEVWRVTDNTSWLGKEADQTAWTFCGSNTITVSAGAQSVPTGIPLDIEVAAGETVGLYINVNDPNGAISQRVRYNSGSNQFGVAASTSHLSLQEGIALDYLFDTTNVYGSTTAGGSSRVFCGTIGYSLGTSGEIESLATSPGGATINGSGLLFEMQAEDYITIEGFELEVNAGTHTLQVWTTREGRGWAQTGTLMNRWQLVGEVQDFHAPVSGLYDVGFDLDVPMAPGQTRAFYITRDVTFSSALKFKDDGLPFLSLADSDGTLTVLTGRLAEPFLAATTFLGEAGFSGTVKYRRNLASESSSLATTFLSFLASGDGPNSGEGLMFDVAAAGDELTQITRLDAIFSTTGTHDMELWVVRDRSSHIGKESSAADWSLVATRTVTATTTGTFTSIFSDLRIVIEPGGVQGLYLTSTGGSNVLSYSAGTTAGSVFASDAFVELRAGSRLNYPFTPSIVNRSADIRIQHSRNDKVLDTISEDFETGAGIKAPAGWSSHVSVVTDPSLHGWNFDDLQPIAPAPGHPFAGRFAVVDSDFAGSGSEDEAFLYSPPFEAGFGDLTLTFDHAFRALSGDEIGVDVWDGTNWNNVFLQQSVGTPNDLATKEIIDITAAAAAHDEARLRFRYKADWGYHWAVDNVRVNGRVGDGQAPRPGLGVMDVNFAREVTGQPVSSNLPGPYFSSAYTVNPVVFRCEGEVNQPLILLQGPLNTNNFEFTQPFDIGKLDIGQFDPVTAEFSNIEEIGNGTLGGFFNALFFTDQTGSCEFAFSLPPFTAGNTYSFQSVILSSFINAAFTNAVSLHVVN